MKKLCIGLLASMVAVLLLSNMAEITRAETVPPDASSSLQTRVQTVLPDDLEWRSNPNVAGVQSAIALGDPLASELYVLFGKMDASAIFPAHSHPDNRITTVLSGMMYYGTGEQFDRANVQPYPAGSVVYTPAGIPHFMWARDGETVMQEIGNGPTGLRFRAEPE